MGMVRSKRWRVLIAQYLAWSGREPACDRLTDDGRGDVGIGPRNERHNRAIGDIPALETMDLSTRFDNRLGIARWTHFARADGMVVVGNNAIDPLGQFLATSNIWSRREFGANQRAQRGLIGHLPPD